MPLLNGSVRARVSPAEIDVTERLSTLVPPQNLEAEESVLGAMLLSATAVGTVSEILGAADFYRESHAKAYRAALALWAKGEPVDAITLVDELDERGELEAVGGQARGRARGSRPVDVERRALRAHRQGDVELRGSSGRATRSRGSGRSVQVRSRTSSIERSRSSSSWDSSVPRAISHTSRSSSRRASNA